MKKNKMAIFSLLLFSQIHAQNDVNVFSTFAGVTEANTVWGVYLEDLLEDSKGTIYLMDFGGLRIKKNI